MRCASLLSWSSMKSSRNFFQQHLQAARKTVLQQRTSTWFSVDMSQARGRKACQAIFLRPVDEHRHPFPLFDEPRPPRIHFIMQTPQLMREGSLAVTWQYGHRDQKAADFLTVTARCESRGRS